MNWINQLFDIQGKFYDFAFTKAKINLQIKLNPYSISKLFFTERITDPATTGIEELELFLYIKKCSTLASDFNQKGQFIKNYNAYNRDSLTLTGSITGISNPSLSIGHKSSNDVFLCLNLPDINKWDSTFLKQRYTLFNSTQCMNIANGNYTND